MQAFMNSVVLVKYTTTEPALNHYMSAAVGRN